MDDSVKVSYAKYKGMDTEAVMKDTNTLSHNDIFEVSELAKEGMHYCIVAGIITGDENGNLKPKNTAIRAETATVITRIQIVRKRISVLNLN